MEPAAASDLRIYRKLQKHLDSQAVGFPATRTGAEIRFLRRMFTEEEAGLALHLSYRPASLHQIMSTASPEFTEEKALKLLNSMSMKGSVPPC